MGNFIKEATFYKSFYSGENPCVIDIGYDDFSVVKPLTSFRIQGFYTLHFVLSGSGTLEIENLRFSVKAGDSFFLTPDVRIRYFPHKDDPWEYVWFALIGDETEQHAKKIGFTFEKPVIRINNFYQVKQILARTIKALQQKMTGYFGVLSAYYEILHLCSLDNPITVPQHIKTFIDSNLTVPDFSIEDLCISVGISHSQILRIFKKAYGKTLIEYLIDKRISLACELLENTDITVEEVAFSSGFSDAPHFMKTFKKKTGISALKYRKENK